MPRSYGLLKQNQNPVAFWPIKRSGGGELFEAGRVLPFSAFRVGAYSSWALNRGWARNRVKYDIQRSQILHNKQTKKKTVWEATRTRKRYFRQGCVAPCKLFLQRSCRCLYQEGGVTGIMLCHQPSVPITEWAYKQEGIITGILRY